MESDIITNIDGNYKLYYNVLPTKNKFKKLINKIYGRQIQSEMNYKNGVLNGPYKVWNRNGHQCIEATYLDGKLEGIYKVWNDKGKLIFDAVYKDGEIYHVEYLEITEDEYKQYFS